MKKFKRFCVIVLAITFILCTALTSAVYAAPTAVNTVQDGVSVKAGDEFSFYVDLTSPYTLKEISAVVLYDTLALDLLTYDPSVAMSYINTNYEPPMESTQNGNGIEFKVESEKPMDFTNQNRFLELKFRANRNTTINIQFYFNRMVASDNAVLIADKDFILDSSVTWETTIQFLNVTKPLMSDCEFLLSESSYTYDGNEKKPVVSVIYNHTVLTKDVHYTVAYSNNINPGTATVTVTGIGNYAGTKTLNFTITESQPQKISVADCTITLDKTVYTYDGSAKKPLVTVKHGTTILLNGLDYLVSYSNNINAGTATATITGIGNYTGTASKTFVIQGVKTDDFIWGTDNWNFNNAAPTYFPHTKFKDQINDHYMNALKQNLTNTEYYAIFEGPYCWLNNQWGGSCYGMSSLTLLAKHGYLPYGNYQASATKLNDFAAPVDNKEISSLITYYQMLQIKDVIQQQYRTVPHRSHETNIKDIISTLDQYTKCIICFEKDGWGAHAILAYDYEYGSWTFNGVTYDGCIVVCDPNSSISYNKEANIYFNSKTYNWAIPFYNYASISSAKGARFMYVGANIDEINQGGYLSGSAHSTVNNYVARIDAAAISEDRTVSKVVGTNGHYMAQASAPGEIVEDYSYIVGSESKGTAGYNIYDANAAYKVKQDTPVELSLSMDYDNCYLTGSSMAGTSVVLDKNGYVEVLGEAADFSLSMTFDENYPTSWFTLSIEGTGASNASLKMEKDGYVLTSDNLSDITVSSCNKDVSANASFSTNYPSVFIYEINETTIGVKADTDNNGTYETVIKTESETVLLGDVNLDNKLNIKDATAIQKHLATVITLDSKALSVADFNEDGKLNIKDVTSIQKRLAGIL